MSIVNADIALCAKCGRGILGAASVANAKQYHTYCDPAMPHSGFGVPHPFPQDNPGATFVGRAEIERMILDALAKYHQTYHIEAGK